MIDEFVVLLAPASLGYLSGALPLASRLFGGPHAARAASLTAASGFMAYAMADGGAVHLENWAPACGLAIGMALAVFHLGQHVKERNRDLRARRDGLLLETRLRARRGEP